MEPKLIKQPRLLVKIGKYVEPPIIKTSADQGKVGPLGLVRYERFSSPSIKTPVRISVLRRTST